MHEMTSDPERTERVPDLARASVALRKGSLSFSLAARLLGPELRRGVTALYWWCRHCDDVIDDQELGRARSAASPDAAGAREEDPVTSLLRATHEAVANGEGSGGVFGGMGWVVRRFQIPAEYPRELLAGMRMDVEGVSYEELDDLRLYCFRVAGVVGLMYSHIAGVSHSAALRHAADLGIAMQLTNIARDIAEDAARGRVYLPRSWLREAGIDGSDILDPARRQALARVVQRLLSVADACYGSGEAGLRYLPWRAAFAAAAASRIYAEIGRLVLARGPRAWEERVVVPTSRKLILVARAFGATLKTVPARLKDPWRAAPLREVWRFS